MGAADAFGRFPAEEPGIVFAPDEAAGVLIDRILRIDVAQIRHGQQTGHVGVVHHQFVAEAVDFKSIDRPVLGMFHRRIFVQGFLHLVGQGAAFAGQGFLAIDGFEDLGRLAQRSHREEVGGDQEEEGRGIVGRPEGRGDEPHRTDGVAPSVPGLGVGRDVRIALELVGSAPFLALLLPERGEYLAHGFEPSVAEDRGIARGFPIMIGQPDGIALGVDLPLALVQVGVHLRVVGLPAAAGRAVVEGIGEGIDAEQAELAVDHAGEHILQMRVAAGQLHIGPDLRPGVAEPHGVDVARINEGPPAAFRVLAEVDGRIEGVRETVGEHPGQARIGEQLRDLGDLVFHGLAHEEPVCRRGALRDKRLGLPRESGREEGQNQQEAPHFRPRFSSRPSTCG